MALKLANDGGDLDKAQISLLAPASTKAVEKPIQRLCITQRKDYPVTTSFPTSLTSLEIHSCKLSRLDSRILKLSLLQRLDLSDNSLKNLPPEWVNSHNCVSYAWIGMSSRSFRLQSVSLRFVVVYR